MSPANLGQFSRTLGLGVPVLALVGCVNVVQKNPVEVVVESDSCCSCCCEDDCGDSPCDEDSGGDGGADGGEEPDPCVDWEPRVREIEVGECASPPDPVPLDAGVYWTWPTVAGTHSFENVMMTPVVGDLNEDGVPEVVFTAFSGMSYGSNGALVVLDGASGTELAYITNTMFPDGRGVKMPGAAGIALGDIDGDGDGEICVAGASGSMNLFCLDHLGNGVWYSTAGSMHMYGYPLIADLDQDGLAEVVLGETIHDYQGNALYVGTSGHAPFTNISSVAAAADIDADGDIEVITGKAAYGWTGSGWGEVWSQPSLKDGFPAVADFDLDGTPEIVIVALNEIQIRDNMGNLINSWPLVDAGRGGPPTVADYDGDGTPEIGVAGATFYAVYEWTGSVVWQTPVTDASSNVTGSAVFDFEADGVAEVVYADETALYIYDGPTGTDRLAGSTIGFASTDHCSGTLYEYPSLADLNGDGSTEIVLASNNYSDPSGWRGVRAIGSLSAAWAGSRPVWNQHAYHITNVEDDLGIPTVQQKNWESYNNFRAADEAGHPGDWLPDLVITGLQSCPEDCSNGEMEVYIGIANAGLVASGPFEVNLSSDAGTLVSFSHAGLASGEAAVLGPVVLGPSAWVGALIGNIDATTVVDECDEANVYDFGEWPCE